MYAKLEISGFKEVAIVRRFVIPLLWAFFMGEFWAQTAVPSKGEMIEQFKAAGTRGLRNLSVEATPPATQPSSTPPTHQ
jgi:hypothetical protein